MPVKFTLEQEAIFDEMIHGESHIIVDALAGTGKTSTATEGMGRRPRGPALFSSFNKKNAMVLKDKMPAWVSSMTLNSLGHRAVTSWNREVTLDKDKVFLLTHRRLNKWEGYLASPVRKLVDLCRVNLLDSMDREVVLAAAMVVGMDMGDPKDEDRILEVVPEVVAECAEKRDVIDFNDQIWFPVIHADEIEAPHFPFVGVDELQDLNPCQRTLVFRCIGDDGRFMGIGDPRQAIYLFRGGTADAMREFEEPLRATPRGLTRLPLTVNFRCSQAVIRVVQKVVPEIKAWEGAPEGAVRVIPGNALIDRVEPGDVILSRLNAPLIDQAMALLMRRPPKPVAIQGREFGGGLVALAKRLGRKASDIDSMLDALNSWQLQEERRVLSRRNGQDLVVGLRDRCSCLRSIIEGVANDGGSVEEVVRMIEDLFRDVDDDGNEKQKVILSTVHRFKGLEAKNVFIIDPRSMPFRGKTTSPEQEKQEINIIYVALSRARMDLNFVGGVPTPIAPLELAPPTPASEGSSPGGASI